MRGQDLETTIGLHTSSLPSRNACESAGGPRLSDIVQSSARRPPITNYMGDSISRVCTAFMP